MDVYSFIRLARGILTQAGKPYDGPGIERIYEDDVLAIQQTIDQRGNTYSVFAQATANDSKRIPIAIVRGIMWSKDNVVLFNEHHQEIEKHLMELAQTHSISTVGILDEQPALKGILADLETMAEGSRDIDARLWWIYANHNDEPIKNLQRVARIGVTAFLDEFFGASIWRDATDRPMVPRYSTDLNASKAFIEAHLPGWGRSTTEPGGSKDEMAKPSASMWMHGYDTGECAAETIELAIYKGIVTALYAKATGQVGG